VAEFVRDALKGGNLQLRRSLANDGQQQKREAGRAAAVQLRHAGHTPAGSMLHKLPID
jgi:hypothetical protein